MATRSDLKLDKRYKLYIDGSFTDPIDGGTFDSYSPVDGEYLATLSEAGRSDVDASIAAASRAFATWKKSNKYARAALLNKIADIIDANAKHLALVETFDNGKPIRETTNVDIPLASEHFRYFAGVILASEGSSSLIGSNTLSLIVREPIGVVGQIIPWNFPFLMAAWKLAPLLASGCTGVLKPSKSTSLSILELMKLVGDIIPKGVVNIITGSGKRTGEYLMHHKGLAKLAFTGSSEVGCSIANAAAKALMPCTLELGGKSANIFFPDCALDRALDGLQLGILFNQGQVCCAGSRVFVHESIYDEFVRGAIECFARVNVAPSYENDAQMGAIVSKLQLEKILGYIELAKLEGAKVAVGGTQLKEGALAKGYYMAPTLLVDVKNSMRVAREEIFGPVACIIRFSSEEEVIAMANDSEYGLAGGVWTRDINRALRVASAIEAGRIWINTYNAVPAGAPFGGYKSSGIGRETHAMMLEHYTQVKNIMINMGEKVSGLYP